MPEYPQSIELAQAVLDRVSDLYPAVETRWLGASDSYHGTIVSFDPGGRGAPALLSVNFDQSYTLGSGRFVLDEDEPTTGELSERAEQITARIVGLATRGIERYWLDRLIGGHREAVEPWPRDSESV